MITFKKTFDYYATDGELDTYINNMLDTVVGDSNHRYVEFKTLDKVLH